LNDRSQKQLPTIEKVDQTEPKIPVLEQKSSASRLQSTGVNFESPKSRNSQDSSDKK